MEENHKKFQRAISSRARRRAAKRLRLGLSSTSTSSSSGEGGERRFFRPAGPVYPSSSTGAESVSDNGNPREGRENIEINARDQSLILEEAELHNLSEGNNDSEHLDMKEPDDNSTESDQLSQDDFGRTIEPDELPDYMLFHLKTWALKGVSKSKVDELLKFLVPVFPYLPCTSRGLLHTPRHIETTRISNGDLWHKGIRKNLQIHLTDQYLQKYGRVLLDIGIDGIPLSKSGTGEFWPILGRLEGQPDNPFIISVFYGSGKPSTLQEFLTPYCDEVSLLKEEGYLYEGQHYDFDIRHYILDAVARAFVKCIGGHNAEKGCEKCSVTGERYLNREVFTDLQRPLRTDASFSARDDPGHHSGTSPLEDHLHTNMVSQFRLDGMHLVHLGIFKRLLGELVGKGPRKAHWRVINLMSDALSALVPHIPKEFARKHLKHLKHYRKFKATELRLLLLYLGVLIFRVLHEHLYHNFLLLHACIFILTSESLLREHCDLAQQFAKDFIEHSIAVFGRQFCVYNVHNLIHLPKECEEHGPMESFSAYSFENFAQIIKNVLKAYKHPLQQLINRDSERDGVLKESPPPQEEEFKVQGQPGNKCIKFRRGFTLSANIKDGSFCTSDGSVVVMERILEDNSGVHLFVKKFSLTGSFYKYPIDSSLLGILKVARLHPEVKVLKPADVKNKCVLLPCSALPKSQFDGEDSSSGDDTDSIPDEGAYLCLPLYAVIAFPDEGDSVSVVVSQWIFYDEETKRLLTYYPPASITQKTNKFHSLLESETEYFPDWKVFPIRILQRYNVLKNAMQGAKIAEEESNLESESSASKVESKRVPKKPKKLLSDDSSDEYADDDGDLHDSESDREVKSKLVRKRKSDERFSNSRKGEKPKIRKTSYIPPPPPYKSELNGKREEKSKAQETTAEGTKELVSAKDGRVPAHSLTSSKKHANGKPTDETSQAVKANKSDTLKQSSFRSGSENLSDVEYLGPNNGGGRKKHSVFLDDLSLRDDSFSALFREEKYEKCLPSDDQTPKTTRKIATIGRKSDLSSTLSPDGHIQSPDTEPVTPTSSHGCSLSQESGFSYRRQLAFCVEDKIGDPIVLSAKSTKKSPRKGYAVRSPFQRSRITADKAETRSQNKLVLQYLDEVKMKLQLILFNQGRIMAAVNPSSNLSVTTLPAGMPTLPLRDTKSLKAMEKFLDKSSHMKLTVDYLASLNPVDDVTGTRPQLSIEDVSLKLVKDLVANTLAKDFNWQGSNGKTAFEPLNLRKAISRVLHRSFPTADVKMIEGGYNKIKRWLATAAQRKS